VTSSEPLDRTTDLPWWRRVVPVCAAVLVVAAVAVALVPPLREELLLSASHRPASYVEMAFTPDGGGQVQPCTRTRAGVEVRFSVAGHGEDVGDRTWRIRVMDPQGGRTPDAMVSGTVRLPQDDPVGVRRLVKGWPGGPYDVLVTLPGTSQRLVAHCGRTP
jgi:hypothetical protein